MSLPSEQATLLVPQGVPELLRDLVHEHTGIYFEADRFDTLLDKLRDRALHHRCHSYLDYYYILKYQEKGRDEWLRVMDAFSVQETYFWRELSQIRALVDIVIPQWFEHHAGPFRIWSAACASGEEPYSIVMALLEAGLGSRPIEIVASDGSEAALERARIGLYRERSFRTLPEEMREKYFTRVPEGWQLDREVLRRVSLRRANIVAPGEIFDLAHSQVVFCRNVFIYFSAEAIRRTVDSFASRMNEGAHLFVGSSESLLRVTPDFELREINDAFGYIRKPRTPGGIK
jgi:chemotaxis protein methyltransferase CheR